MAYCTNCGQQIGDHDTFCPSCGAKQDISDNYEQNQYYNNPNQYSQGPPPPPYYEEDTGSIGWIILGFFIPLAGLILYLVWKDTKPISAKQAGKGAIIGFVAPLALYLLAVILIAIFMALS